MLTVSPLCPLRGELVYPLARVEQVRKGPLVGVAVDVVGRLGPVGQLVVPLEELADVWVRQGVGPGVGVDVLGRHGSLVVRECFDVCFVSADGVRAWWGCASKVTS